jgi:hypothetical protein
LVQCKYRKISSAVIDSPSGYDWISLDEQWMLAIVTIWLSLTDEAAVLGFNVNRSELENGWFLGDIHINTIKGNSIKATIIKFLFHILRCWLFTVLVILNRQCCEDHIRKPTDTLLRRFLFQGKPCPLLVTTSLQFYSCATGYKKGKDHPFLFFICLRWKHFFFIEK